jgi:hypothetical protein
MSTHDYSYKYGSLILECQIDYEGPERGAREYGTGLQLEPDYPESADVISVSINGVDITDIIREDIFEEIQEAFLSQEQEVDWDYDYD